MAIDYSSHIRDKEFEFIEASAMSLDDPAFDQFYFWIDFNAFSGLFANENYENSALAYLKRTGELLRYERLQKAIINFTNVLSKQSYRLQSVEGLNNLMTEYKKVGKFDIPLTLNFYENITWDIRQFMLTVNDCLFDISRGLYVLPDNLRKFNAILYFTDYRALPAGLGYNEIFGSDISNLPKRYDYTYNKPNESVENSPVPLEKQQHVCVHLDSCTFDINNFPLQANNVSIEERKHSLTIKLHKFEITGLFPKSEVYVYNPPKDIETQIGKWKKPSVKDKFDKVKGKYGEMFGTKDARFQTSEKFKKLAKDALKRSVAAQIQIAKQRALNSFMNLSPSFMMSKTLGRILDVVNAPDTLSQFVETSKEVLDENLNRLSTRKHKMYEDVPNQYGHQIDAIPLSKASYEMYTNDIKAQIQNSPSYQMFVKEIK